MAFLVKGELYCDSAARESSQPKVLSKTWGKTGSDIINLIKIVFQIFFETAHKGKQHIKKIDDLDINADRAVGVRFEGHTFRLVNVYVH